jgi:putative transposase
VADPEIASPVVPSLPQPNQAVVPSAHLQIEVLRRPVESAEYTSIAFTTRLLDAGVDASVGTVGDALDNSLAESKIGLYKTELIRQHGPWRTCHQVELATSNTSTGTTIADPTPPRPTFPS